MGLGTHAVEAIVREHKFRPIDCDVLMIGRQTVYFTPENLLLLLRDHGINLNVDPGTIELDKTTIDRKTGADPRLVTDAALFRLLGARKVMALDHSPYEGAEVIHNLHQPLPESLERVADFIVDGSTLDNVFTPSTVLQNYAKLLRPGGRMILVNAFSAHNTAYSIMPPLWYVDYFVMNKFADCKAYILMFIEREGYPTLDNVFYVDLDHLYEAKRGMGRFVSPHQMVTVIFAEKGQASTADRIPNQQDYRAPEEWTEYQSNLDRMRKSRRYHLVRSRSRMAFTPTVSGHPFIDGDFDARK